MNLQANESNKRLSSYRVLLIPLCLTLLFLTTLLLGGCGDSGGSLEQMKIPFTEARFIEEAGKGNLQAVKLFVDGGMKVAGENAPGLKAFAVAVKGKQELVLSFLRQAGVVTPAEVELRKKGVPYNVAEFLKRAEAGDPETVKLFLAAGMNPNAQSVDGRTALSLAEKRNNDNMVALLKAAGAKVNSVEGLKKLGLKFDPATFLTVVNKGNLAAVKLFVEGGIPLDAKDPQELTPLAWAVHGNHLEVAEYLLSKKANPNVNMLIPGGRLRKRGASEIIEVQATSINVALLEAAYHENEKMARLLVKYGAVAGGPELTIAVYRGQLGFVKVVLPPGIYKKKPESYLYTFALRTNKTQIAEVLAKLGAREYSAGNFPKSLKARLNWVFQTLTRKFGRGHTDYARIFREVSRIKL